MRTILLVVLAVAVGFIIIGVPVLLPGQGFSPIPQASSQQTQSTPTSGNVGNLSSVNLTSSGEYSGNNTNDNVTGNFSEYGNASMSTSTTQAIIGQAQAVSPTYTPFSLLFIPSVVLLAGALAALAAYVLARRGALRIP
jgi:hypothetical protein